MRGSDSSGSGLVRPRSAQTSGTRDLIGDIHRNHRRRIARRVAQLGIVAALVGGGALAVSAFADGRARDEALRDAERHLLLGTSVEVQTANRVLTDGLERLDGDSELLALQALARGHGWIEFDHDAAGARAALLALDPDHPAAAVANAFVAFGDGAVQRASDELAAIAVADLPSMAAREARWLAGHVAVAAAGTQPEGDGHARIDAVRQDVQAWVAEHADDIAMRRLLAYLELQSGAADEALKRLAKIREASPGHMGLAADDALYHAVLRTKLAGVASVADQLLESNGAGLSSADRAHAVLARAVVHAHSGERESALQRLDEAWQALPPWGTLVRRLAIETSLEAGDDTRVGAWVEETALPDGEAEVFVAWGVLLGGDTMTALEALAALPQTHPRVGYLQALALVEQGRFEEAQPWLTRTESLLPGRVEIEVARARTEVRLGNALTALGKLTALAEFEPYAPRAWTGLGEAHLMQDEPKLDEAKRALRRAIEREPVPADAMLLLARVALRDDPKASAAKLEALRLFERAAKVNPHLPKFGQALALHLEQMGFDARAKAALQAELDRPGAGPDVPLALAEVMRRAVDPDLAEIDALLDEAETRKAEPGPLAIARARTLLLRGDDASLRSALGLLSGRLRRTPTDVVAHALTVRALLAQRDIAGAENALRKGLAAAEPGTKGRLYFEWARLEARTGRTKVAAPRSRRAWVELLTEERSTWELLDAGELSVRLWLRSKMERVATTIAKQLTDRVGYHSRAWTVRARAELAAGEGRAARVSADKAVALDGQDPRAHEVLGDCLLRFGNRDRAKIAYERAVELARGTSAEAGLRKHLRRW